MICCSQQRMRVGGSSFGCRTVGKLVVHRPAMQRSIFQTNHDRPDKNTHIMALNTLHIRLKAMQMIITHRSCLYTRGEYTNLVRPCQNHPVARLTTPSVASTLHGTDEAADSTWFGHLEVWTFCGTGSWSWIGWYASFPSHRTDAVELTWRVSSLLKGSQTVY